MVRVTRLSITDTLADGSYRTMSFQYGPDCERWYSELAEDGETSRSTVYAGNYEKVTENGVTREFYYLDGNVIVVKQNDVFTPYLAFTDHLGSVLAILDEYGLYRFRSEYDVWGKPTVSPNLIGFHRGYTGHEMLPEFDLINMNGRLYDPMIGRFLSPDNYVQEPDNSQNFNRYSYCLNNPLKYTDPSGELFGIDDAVFAFAAFNMAASMMHAAAMGGSAGDIWKAGGISLLSSAGTYGIGSAFSALGSAGVMSKTGLELCRAGAHGLNSGIISSLGGGNFGVGFLSGASASGIGSFAQYVHMNPGLMLASTSAMGGISSWATGGGFLSGAINGMYIGAFNHLEHTENGITFITDGPDDGGYALGITAPFIFTWQRFLWMQYSRFSNTFNRAVSPEPYLREYWNISKTSTKSKFAWNTKKAVKNTFGIKIKTKTSSIYKSITKGFKYSKFLGPVGGFMSGGVIVGDISQQQRIGVGHMADFGMTIAAFSPHMEP